MGEQITERRRARRFAASSARISAQVVKSSDADGYTELAVCALGPPQKLLACWLVHTFASLRVVTTEWGIFLLKGDR